MEKLPFICIHLRWRGGGTRYLRKMFYCWTETETLCGLLLRIESGPYQENIYIASFELLNIYISWAFKATCCVFYSNVWIARVFSNVSLFLKNNSEWRTNGLSFTSQSTQFQDFLLRANKYKCLKMVGDGGATDRKFILVEVCTTLKTLLPFFYWMHLRCVLLNWVSITV